MSKRSTAPSPGQLELLVSSDEHGSSPTVIYVDAASLPAPSSIEIAHMIANVEPGVRLELNAYGESVTVCYTYGLPAGQTPTGFQTGAFEVKWAGARSRFVHINPDPDAKRRQACRIGDEITSRFLWAQFHQARAPHALAI